VLGVSAQEVTQALAQALRLPTPAGALVSKVHADSAAAKAGLQAGDVIVGIDGHAVQSYSDLPLWIAMAVPGQQVQIDLLRNGAPVRTHATLEAPAATRPASAEVPATTPVLLPLGLAVRPLLPLEQRAADTRTGLMVEGVAPELAGKIDIAPGDILLAINQTTLTSVEQARALLSRAEPTVALLVQHKGERLYIAVTLKPGV
jgi:serine protease Do